MFQPIDGEAGALRELGARVSRVRGVVAAVSVVAALILGVGGYVELRAFLLDHVGVHSPYVTGGVTIGVALGASSFAATRISRLLIRGRATAWIETARAHHQVAAIEPLKQFIDMWS
jgi:hypothetical protein